MQRVHQPFRHLIAQSRSRSRDLFRAQLRGVEETFRRRLPREPVPVSAGELAGSVLSARLTHAENSSGESYVRQLGKVLKKALEGCCAQMTYLPMASASAVVVATTSDSDGLMNTL